MSTPNRAGTTYPQSPLDHAFSFATKAHKGQTRKDGKTPYMVHPARVVDLLCSHGITDNDILAAAYLHDVVEDCEVSLSNVASKFGSNVARLVGEMTKTDSETRREYIDSFRHKDPGSCAIKLADRIDNLNDWDGMDEGFREDYAGEALILVGACLSNRRACKSELREAIAKLSAELLQTATRYIGVPP